MDRASEESAEPRPGIDSHSKLNVARAPRPCIRHRGRRMGGTPMPLPTNLPKRYVVTQSCPLS
jgi:hypothetical protein